MERHWQSKVEVLRLQWWSYEENTELTHKIQELHALVCASCYAQYELLVMQNQFGPDSPHINYQQLKLPLQLWSEDELINRDQEPFSFFLSCLIICSNFSFWVCCIIWVWIVGSPFIPSILMTYKHGLPCIMMIWMNLSPSQCCIVLEWIAVVLL